jgi:DnaJ-class molecular chaperone
MINPAIHLSHYALLRIDNDATADQIEAAYRDACARLPKTRLGLAMARVLNGESPETLRTAYKTLIDPKVRAEYDRWLASCKFDWYPPC